MSPVGFGGSTTTNTTTTANSSNTCQARSDIVYVDYGCATPTNAPKSTVKISGKQAVFQVTIPVWDDVGCDQDNIRRVYNTDECVYLDGLVYWSLEDGNTTKPPSAKWSEGVSKCKMLKPAAATVLSCEWVQSLSRFDNTVFTNGTPPTICDSIKGLGSL